MKNKYPLLFGYLTPFLTSLGISYILYKLLPKFLTIIATLFSSNFSLVLTLFGIEMASIIVFQPSVIKEDNIHVLSILKDTNVRKVFFTSLAYQIILSVILLFSLMFLSISAPITSLIGFLEVFCTMWLFTELLSIITNGYHYQKIREEIIIAVSNVNKPKNDKTN